MKRRLAAALLTTVFLVPGAALAGASQDGEGKPEKAKPVPTSKAKPATTKKKGKVAKKAAKDLLGPRPRTKDEALRYLDQRRISVNFDDESLADVIKYLSAVTGVNIMVGKPVLEDQHELKITMKLKRLSAKSVLELVAKQHRLAIGWSHGVLMVTSQKAARGKPVLRLYMVGDITQPIRDFPAPDIMLRPAGAEYEPEEETVVERAFSDADDILTLVRENTGGESWDDDATSSGTMKNWLVIRQYPEVHKEIAALLRMLRASQ
ncbi:MAG: hypothetical protein ACYTG4_13585 [Planctomycetota bacterium]|jgi:hypothetical protein